MTTTVVVKVNGQYIATVTQDDKPPVDVGPNGEQSFTIIHGTPGGSTFQISERAAESKPEAGKGA